MRADGGDHDGGHGGMDHAGACRHRVRRAARRRRHYQPCKFHVSKILLNNQNVC